MYEEETENDCIFREARSSDDLAIHEIFAEAKLSFPAKTELSNANVKAIGSIAMHVCEHRGEVVGVALWRNLGHEAEILDIAISAKHRRKGYGHFLLESLLHVIQERGTRNIFLEVRESNIAALSLYGKSGFSISGRRANYYQNSSEAALLLHLKIPS
jgi:ribosomal-protein-alanine N-acetyltransferase